MAHRATSSSQLQLFGNQPREPTVREEDTEREALPIVYNPRRASYSALATRATCPHRYYWMYPGMWQGWGPEAPRRTQEAYWTSRRVGWQGWAGNLVHDFAEALLWNDIDRVLSEHTNALPQTEAELCDALQRRFEGEWLQSRGWTEETFRKTRRRPKPVWLAEHATGIWPHLAAGENDPGNIRAKRKCQQWVDRSVAALRAHRQEYHEGTLPENFLFIEGKRLRGGLIVRTDAQQNMPEAALRANNIYPTEPFVVDGEEWQVSVMTDHMVYTPQEKYLIIDYKTGNDKYWEYHRKQLRLYAALMLRNPLQFAALGLPPVTPDILCLRAVYTDPKAHTPWREWTLEAHDVAWLTEELREMIRALRQHFLRLDELTSDEREELRHTMSPSLFAGPHGLFLEEGITIRPGVDPATLVALPSLFPPVQARQRNVRMCEKCQCLAHCPEGREALEIAAKK